MRSSGVHTENSEDFRAQRKMRSLPPEAVWIGGANRTRDAIIGGEANPSAPPQESVFVDFGAHTVAGFDERDFALFLLLLSVDGEDVAA
ncbi:hypothetical protein SLA2020_515510 [Shorea laevis]